MTAAQHSHPTHLVYEGVSIGPWVLREDSKRSVRVEHSVTGEVAWSGKANRAAWARPIAERLNGWEAAREFPPGAATPWERRLAVAEPVPLLHDAPPVVPPVQRPGENVPQAEVDADEWPDRAAWDGIPFVPAPTATPIEDPAPAVVVDPEPSFTEQKHGERGVPLAANATVVEQLKRAALVARQRQQEGGR